VTYLPRVLDDELDALFPQLAAISLDGPKGVGKTVTATRRCRGQFQLDSAARRETLPPTAAATASPSSR